MAQSRAFAQGEYATALLKGASLSAAERRTIAEKVARFTGLTAEQIEDNNLRIGAFYFREMLLRKENKIIGRFDSRVTSEDGDRSENGPDFDPSFTNIIGPFSAAVNAYIRGDLEYESDLAYRVLTPVPWKYESFSNRYVSLEDRLGNAMKINPRLRVIVLSGLRDLAVPEDSMRFSFDHIVTLPPGIRANITWARYESGHMMYLYQKDSEKLRRDLLNFLKPVAK